MFKKGISIYTGLADYSMEKNIEYLLSASKLGYEIIFSSAHINEATKSFDDLEKIVNMAYEHKMKVVLDVSKPMMEKFVIPTNLYALRLDYGFTKQEIVELSQKHQYKIELNASTLSEEVFEELIKLGLDTSNIRVSFNFYPKLYTAHDIGFVKNKISIFKKYNIDILAFLPSHYGFRPPMYEGLPTIEKHRKMDLNLAIEELKAIGIDEIAFGDAYAKIEELEILNDHQKEELVLPFSFFEGGEKFIDDITGTFKIRPDYNDLMLRSTSNRGKNDIPTFNTIERKFGYVTIDNNNFLRYKGEINIILSDLPADNRVNVIGKVDLTKELIYALKTGQKFIFGVKSSD